MKRLVSLLSLLALLVSVAAPLSAAVATPANETGMSVAETSLYQQILERDGFIDGVWYPWFTHDNLGNGFSSNFTAAQWVSNPWYDFGKVGIDSYGADKIYAEIYNLKQVGYNMLAIAGSAYGEGVLYDENGDVLGIKQEYLDNARRFLDMCREIGMPIMWNICFHSSSMPGYYSIDPWYIICRMYGDREVADHYVERFVRPLCQMLAEYKDVIALVCLVDEVENEIYDNETNYYGDAKNYGVNKDDMVYFVTAMNNVVAEELPDVDRTLAANNDDLSSYAHLGLETLGRNRYSNEGTIPTPSSLYTTAPMLLTEFNIATLNNVDEDDYTSIQIQFREEMKRKGYDGGVHWCWQPNAKGGAMDLLRSDATSTTDFRGAVYQTYYYTADNRAAHRGEEVTLDAPVLFFNEGTGLVEWIPSRQATAIDILRSTDGGGSWRTLVSGADQADYIVKDKGVYQDPNPAANAIYMVVAWDENGNTAQSEPTNVPGVENQYVREVQRISVAKEQRAYVPPARVDFPSNAKLSLTSFGATANRPSKASNNLIENGSFENAAGGQWKEGTFLASAEVVKDATAPNGSKSLHFDTRSSETPEWYTFTVKVSKNTDYTLSAWLKGTYLTSDSRFYTSLGVLDPSTGRFATYGPYEGHNSCTDQQLYPTAFDDEWHLRSVRFNSGNHTQITIALYGYRSQMWVDDIALFKDTDGIRYLGENATGSLRLSYFYPYDRCEPDVSLIENPDFEGKDHSFWESGYGWDNGFLSIQESRYGYGNALKYTALDQPWGLSYIKWIDVKPHTDYVLSFQYKILEEGAGCLSIITDKLSIPTAFMTIEFLPSGYPDENGWYTVSVQIDSNVYDRIGLRILDYGGSALIDNIRLFRTNDGSDMRDMYTYTVKANDTAAYGETASVTARASGDGLTYRWYYKDKGASQFSLTTTFKSKTYAVSMNAARDGRQVYCVITDKYGVSRRTATTTLTVDRRTPKITAQPKIATYAKRGAKASVTVKATGDGLKYQWYYRNAGSTQYSKSSVTSATYSVTMSDKVHGRRLYCVVTDAWGKTVKTQTVILRQAASIVTQPTGVTVAKNKTAKTTVKAVGDGLTYVWYVKDPGSAKYVRSSVKSATYSCTMIAKRNGRKALCYVYDKYGNKVQSQTVVLKMK